MPGPEANTPIACCVSARTAKFTNIRRVFVDNRTTPPTFWVGNNHGASIVRLEPLD